MPTDKTYSLQDLAKLAGVSPRTVRYYVAQGLLPSPGQVGPGTRYTDAHLNRLRLIRRLQREHLPLAEIRSQLAKLDDETIAELEAAESEDETEPGPETDTNALDYVRMVLGQPTGPDTHSDAAGVLARRGPAFFAVPVHRSSPFALRAMTVPAVDQSTPGAPPKPGAPAMSAPQTAETPSTSETAQRPASEATATATPERSQWDRVSLAPDIELHIRRPLSRLQNKRVDRLIAIARELLEEEPS